MRLLYKRYALTTIMVVFVVCIRENNPIILHNNINYFINSINQAGLAVYMDTTKTYRNNNYRKITVANAVYCVYSFPQWYNIIVQPEHDTTPYSLVGDRILLPVLKDSNGIKLYREFILRKQNDTISKSWVAIFTKDSILYDLHFNGIVYGNLYWFTKKIHLVLYASGKTAIDSIIEQIRIEQKQYFFHSDVLSTLKNYISNTAKPISHQSRCYSGKIIQFPGDTLSPNDSAAFRDCVIRYRRDHGLEPAFIIDTCLLKSLKIPLNPIEEGLKRYYKEFAEKSR